MFKLTLYLFIMLSGLSVCFSAPTISHSPRSVAALNPNSIQPLIPIKSAEEYKKEVTTLNESNQKAATQEAIKSLSKTKAMLPPPPQINLPNIPEQTTTIIENKSPPPVMNNPSTFEIQNTSQPQPYTGFQPKPPINTNPQPQQPQGGGWKINY